MKQTCKIGVNAFICLAVACCAMAGLLTANSSAGTSRIAGQDDFGRQIVLEKPPERIVLLSGSPIDVIYELGAGDLLVGVVDSIDTSYPDICRRYPSVVEKERVGRFSDPNIEKIIALDPDLIIPFASSETPGKYTAVFDKRGLPYAAFVSVENTAFGIAQVKRLGRLLGRENQAAALAHKIRTEVDALSRMISSKARNKPLVYYWWGARNGTYGANTAINELIELAGGINIAGQFNTQYMELSPEYVIASDPDVIIVSFWKENQKDERIKALKQRPGFSDIKAVKNNRIHTIDGHSFHTVVRFAEVIQTLAGYIHPELFDKAEHQ
ncbi:MAG: ABC transporter substrate-binding protein [Proteobacteria bacterium]|nr:ABC transporter substrate-binding protein [Pseudomonadota bacterium]MBU1581134.1 ABC transporter substrate-binding protein [Pseudomonadota bacterium]MBU2454747.1 ABC transporter substrate-binding protein [Pseudomonadota bacterium]MBU2631434.1 ABC transporter substrate-binding protein [Pseudomonadota bacterium]